MQAWAARDDEGEKSNDCRAVYVLLGYGSTT